MYSNVFIIYELSTACRATWSYMAVARFRGTRREYSSKPLKHSIVERILVFKR